MWRLLCHFHATPLHFWWLQACVPLPSVSRVPWVINVSQKSTKPGNSPKVRVCSGKDSPWVWGTERDAFSYILLNGDNWVCLQEFDLIVMWSDSFFPFPSWLTFHSLVISQYHSTHSHIVWNCKRSVLTPTPQCLQSPQACFLCLQDLWKYRLYRLRCKIPSLALPSGNNIISKFCLHFPVLYPTHFLHLVAPLIPLERFSGVLPISLLCNIFSSLEAKKPAHPILRPFSYLIRSDAWLFHPRISVSPNPILSQI